MQGLNKRRFRTKACIAGAKTFLMLYNIIFWVIGLIMLILGMWMKVSLLKFFAISREYNFGLPSLFMVTGIVIMIVAFIACSCTSKEQPKMLFTLATFFFIIFIIVVAASISGYVHRDKLQTNLHSGFNLTLHDYGSGGLLDTDVDRVQEYLRCCGVDSYSDWKNTTWGQRHQNQTVPYSCCVYEDRCDTIDLNQIHQNGCYPMIMDLLTNNLSSVGLGMIFIALFQLFGIFLSSCLAVNINKALYEEMH